MKIFTIYEYMYVIEKNKDQDLMPSLSHKTKCQLSYLID